MKTFVTGCLAAGLASALLTVGWTEARAQAPGAPAAAPAASTWYQIPVNPNAGWTGYAPASSPAPGTPSVAPMGAAPDTTATVPPGWTGYAPATAWAGYAPASAPGMPLSAVRMVPRNYVLPHGTARRQAASAFVNRNRPEFAGALHSYREYGSGRSVPLTKPWLPHQP